jgi:hypothetical protein
MSDTDDIDDIDDLTTRNDTDAVDKINSLDEGLRALLLKAEFLQTEVLRDAPLGSPSDGARAYAHLEVAFDQATIEHRI